MNEGESGVNIYERGVNENERDDNLGISNGCDDQPTNWNGTQKIGLELVSRRKILAFVLLSDVCVLIGNEYYSHRAMTYHAVLLHVPPKKKLQHPNVRLLCKSQSHLKVLTFALECQLTL